MFARPCHEFVEGILLERRGDDRVELADHAADDAPAAPSSLWRVLLRDRRGPARCTAADFDQRASAAARSSSVPTGCSRATSAKLRVPARQVTEAPEIRLADAPADARFERLLQRLPGHPVGARERRRIDLPQTLEERVFLAPECGDAFRRVVRHRGVIGRPDIREAEVDEERIECGDGVDVVVAEALQFFMGRIRV